MAHDFTDEELEGLSDAEREAILADGDEDNAQIGDTTPDVVDDDADDNQDGVVAAEAGDAPPVVEDDPDAPQAQFVPVYSVAPPEDAAEQFAAIEAKKQALRDSLNGGDIGLDEYTAQADAIGKEERALERQVWEAESAQKQKAQSDKQRWEWEQEQFFDGEKNAVYKDKYLLGALNAAVIDIANDPANKTRSGPWILAEADRVIRARFNLAGEQKDTPKDPMKAKIPARARVQVPPTVGNMPNAEIPDTGGGDEFAHLDKLNPFEREAALARLTPDQEARYLRG
jgi:hypothetical protein